MYKSLEFVFNIKICVLFEKMYIKLIILDIYDFKKISKVLLVLYKHPMAVELGLVMEPI